MPWNSAGTAGKGEAASGVKGAQQQQQQQQGMNGGRGSGSRQHREERRSSSGCSFNSEVLRECSRTRSGFGEGLLGIGARLPPRCHGNVRVELQPDRDVRTPELPLQPLPGSASPLGSKVLVEPFDPHFGFLFIFFFKKNLLQLFTSMQKKSINVYS